MRLTSNKLSGVLLFLFLMPGALTAQREFGGMYPEQRLQNTRNNANTVDWVGVQRDAATSAAAPWAAKSDEELWAMIPGQQLPRTIDVTWDYDFPSKLQLGCLNCGLEIAKYGNYPYTPDFETKPWKLTCPNCAVVFPTNDFEQYYRSGIDGQGLFNRTTADSSLLFNAAHPNPADPLHKYGVDDGYGYVDVNGREHKFIGYYAWKYWRHILSGLTLLSEAYVFSGDKMYARKAAIMMDRIADVYPAMDWKPYADRGWYHSDGGNRVGKIEGRIWETQTVQQLARAYDRIISGTVENPELYAFLQAKDQQFNLPGVKGTRAALVTNIDSGVLNTAAAALISGQIKGNEGMHQSSMACAALALNTEPKTSQWLDWIFAADGGHIPKMMIELFDRDGMADEAAPGYCYLWPGKIKEIMDILEPYSSYTKNRISRDFPYFRNAFRAPWRVQALNTFMPNIGDTGAVGTITPGISPDVLAAGYEFFGDETAARYAWEANGRRSTGLLTDVGSTTPDVMNERLEQAALNYNGAPRFGENMAGYGLASFEFGNTAAGKALWMYYGRNKGHGHQDRLNYSIYAFNTDLTPDLGYPDFASSTYKPRAAWNNNTLSHNTVVVDKKIQTQNWTGYPRFYGAAPGFGVAEVQSKNVYPQCTEYARTISFVEAPDGNAYAVDIFRVSGGTDHLMSFHGPPGAVTLDGMSLNRQTTGTYAGPTVAYGDNSTAHPFGYSYLKNVQRSVAPATSFKVDWKADTGYRGVKTTDDIHMRLHFVGALTDVALADGVPAQNKPGNPELMRYALLHRASSTALSSQFVSVAEPWKATPFVENVTRLPITTPDSAEVVAVKVDLAGGTTDYFISNPTRKSVQASGGIATDGAYAWLRVSDGKITSASLTQGTNLSFGGKAVAGTGNIAGTLVRFEKNVNVPAVAWVQISEGDPDTIKGSQIIFANDGVRNACYDIMDVQRDGELWKITCGPGTFARGFVNSADYSKGYVYNVKEGASFYVPVTTVFNNPGNEQTVNAWASYGD